MIKYFIAMAKSWNGNVSKNMCSMELVDGNISLCCYGRGYPYAQNIISFVFHDRDFVREAKAYFARGRVQPWRVDIHEASARTATLSTMTRLCDGRFMRESRRATLTESCEGKLYWSDVRNIYIGDFIELARAMYPGIEELLVHPRKYSAKSNGCWYHRAPLAFAETEVNFGVDSPFGEETECRRALRTPRAPKGA